MTVHHLKTHPNEYRATVEGRKPFEYRRDDRGFAVGDELHLQEWDPDTEQYTGSATPYRVTYKLSGGEFGVPCGYCVLGVELLCGVGIRGQKCKECGV